MSTYTPNPTRHTAITLPDDGDDYDAASVNVPLSAALDSTEYLAQKRLGVVPDVATLKAIAAPADGETRILARQGLYRFVVGGGSGVQEPFGYAADDASGNWLWGGQFGLDDQRGACLVVTDSSTEQLLRPDVVPYRTVYGNGVGYGSDPPAGVFQTIGGITWTQVAHGGAGLNISLGKLEVGDIVEATAHVSACTGGADAYLAMAVNGTANLIPGTVTLVPAAIVSPTPSHYTLHGVYTVTSAGAAGLGLYARSSVGGGTIQLWEGVSLSGKVIRP